MRNVRSFRERFSLARDARHSDRPTDLSLSCGEARLHAAQAAPLAATNEVVGEKSAGAADSR